MSMLNDPARARYQKLGQRERSRTFGCNPHHTRYSPQVKAVYLPVEELVPAFSTG